jgi:tight adherence protein B
MTALAVFLLAAAASLLLLRPRHQDTSHRRLPPNAPPEGRRRRQPRIVAARLDQLPVFVRQLAALLRSGRTPAQLWTDMLAVHNASGGMTPNQRQQEGSGTVLGSSADASSLLLPGLREAAHAADLGLGLGPVLRRQRPGSGRGADPSAAEAQRMWHDLACCWEVSERTGAPLALLLENYARHLQQRLDGRAARRTALAGPKATAVLLGWLPLLGLGLGTAMGADPIGTLLIAPSGWPILLIGVGLMVGARFWSRQLVRLAAGPEGL